MMKEIRRWEMDAIGRGRLKMATREKPRPAAGEVLVRVAAVSLNYRDKMVIESGRGLSLTYPFTPGSDMAGTIVELGEQVDGFDEGDRVISVFTPDWIDGRRPGNARTPAYRTLGGFYPGVLSEYVAIPAAWVVHAPRSLNDLQASTLPCAGLTAWFALVERSGVKAGDRVLIPGTGGVALFGLLIAKMSGAEVIVATQPSKGERVLALGADHWVDRSRDDWMEAVYALTDDEGVDHVLDVVGGDNLGVSVQLAAVGGHVCQIGALAGFDIASPAMPLMLKDVTIHGIGTGSRRALERFVRAVDQARLEPVIDARYSLAELPQALDHLDQRPFGKIVIDVHDD
tara:strand:- start:729 stop:1757 length:1029 start_codon:yes stop_codon:yes gene_type:complete